MDYEPCDACGCTDFEISATLISCKRCNRCWGRVNGIWKLAELGNREIDPDTYPTHADLSRADHRLLHKLCLGKHVVEFGCGGSTLFLHEIASSLRSYETSLDWADLVRRKNPKVEIALTSSLHAPQTLPPADVYFVDGLVSLRAAWVGKVMQERLAKTVIMHDTRRAEPVRSLRHLLEWPHTAILDKVEYHAEGSNCLVITLRDKPVVYEDWNATEPANRLPALNKAT